METTNGMLAISQIMSEMNQAESEWRDWDKDYSEGPWDKESWSDDWDDSHNRQLYIIQHN